MVPQSVSAWGFKTLLVKFSKTRFLNWILLAEVANPILVRDFFKKFDLLISPPPTHKVLFASSLDSILDVDPPQGPPPPPACTQVSTPQRPPSSTCQPSVQQEGTKPLPSQVDKLLKEFPGLINSGVGSPHPRHGVQHVIEMIGRPVFARFHRLDQTS